MNKKISYVYSFLLIFALAFNCISVFSPFIVKAEEKPKRYLVNYGGLIKNNNLKGEKDTPVYSALSVVRSRYYKEANNPDKEGVTPVNTNDTEKGITKENICDSNMQYGYSNHTNYIRNNLCKNGELNPAIGEVYIYDNGDVTVVVEGGYSLISLRIFYTVYSKSQTDRLSSMLFCDVDTGNGNKSTGICSNAKNISPGSNWKQDTKNPTEFMNFTYGNIVNRGFKESENKDTGTKTYTGYNIIDNMETRNAELVVKNGAFVSFDFTIKSKDSENAPSYSLNRWIDRVNFDSMRNYSNINRSKLYSTIVSNSSYKDIKETVGDSIYGESVESLGHSVDSYTSLIFAKSHNAYNEEGALRMMQKVDTILVPILYSLLGLMLVVRGTMLTVTIVKSSDEPEVRSSAIKHLVSLFVSIFAIFMIVYFYKDIYKIMRDIIV